MQSERPEFDPWVQKIPWRKEWLPASVFLSEEFHGQKSLVSYSPWVCKELDMTERLSTAHLICLITSVLGGGDSNLT